MKWFKHDCQSHNDEKIRELIHQFGIEGYGVYMVILELIGEKIDRNLDAEISISDRVLREKLRVSRGKLTRILSYFGDNLLTFSNLESGSWIINCPNILKRLDNWTTNSQVTTKQPSNQQEVKKENKKEKENTPIRPSIENIQTILNREMALEFFDYYQANGWKVGRNPMKDWKAAARNWSRRQHNFKKPDNPMNLTKGQLRTQASMDQFKKTREYEKATGRNPLLDGYENTTVSLPDKGI